MSGLNQAPPSDPEKPPKGFSRRVAIWAALLLLGGPVQAQKALLMTGEWEPYTSEKTASKGAFTEIVTAVFQDMKLDCDVRFAPWKRVEEAALTGTAVAAFPYVLTGERAKTFEFSAPVMTSQGKFFYYKPSQRIAMADWTAYADLQGLRLGGTLGYWYEKDFSAAGLSVEYAASDELNFKKLQAGRVDLIATDEWVGRALIDRLFPGSQSDFQVLPRPLNSSTLRLMISRRRPDAPALIRRFNASLRAIRRSGRYARILARYGIRP